MNILITGGAGYIGSHTIIEILEHTDWTPISVDDLRSSSIKTYERIERISGKKVAHYEIDLTDRAATARVFEENDIHGVIHFAALKTVPESVSKPTLYYKNNINSLANILELQIAHSVRPHIFSSSCSVYGNAEVERVTEQTPLRRAESPYAQTKVIGERILQDLVRSNDQMKVIALRYFNPVGAHESGLIGESPLGVPDNLVPYITQTAIGERDSLTVFGNDYPTRDGTCVRDYVHVSDIASAHVLAMQRLLSDQQQEAMDIINLGTGTGSTVKEMIEAFEKVNGLNLPHTYGARRAGDVMAVYADRSRAAERLGWRPERDLAEMMRSAWQWQKQLSAEKESN